MTVSGSGARVGTASTTSTATVAIATSSLRATTRPIATTSTAATTTTTSDVGARGQTTVLPAASGPQFAEVVASLWRGVVTGNPADAGASFFPESAYIHLKAISWAAADFTGRLLVEFGNDLTAAHRLLGAHPSDARFVRVVVDEHFAHWIPPNVCYNRDGYYEVPNSRLVYSLDGRLASFGIASFISWRGVWYVVHLGAVLRASTAGVVDDPLSGPGVPTYSSTC